MIAEHFGKKHSPHLGMWAAAVHSPPDSRIAFPLTPASGAPDTPPLSKRPQRGGRRAAPVASGAGRLNPGSLRRRQEQIPIT
jgi:hypothetical protein